MGEKADLVGEQGLERLAAKGLRWLPVVTIVSSALILGLALWSPTETAAASGQTMFDAPPALPPPTKAGEYRLVVKGSEPVALVTTAALRREAEKEYGELKASYVFAISTADKARYCEAHGWSLVVGGEVPETKGRSARWTKIAWLRRLSKAYEWLVWMDLDTLIVKGDVDLRSAVVARDADAFFTLDHGGGGDRVNTGSFLLRRSEWTDRFLWTAWRHNDDGLGESDQNSINYALGLDSSRSALVPKTVLNAFPTVRYVPTEAYEAAPNGDESEQTLVVHYAGQFGGARATDGQTPPTMLVQFLDLMLRRFRTSKAEGLLLLEEEKKKNEGRLRSKKEKTPGKVSQQRDLVEGALGAFEECLRKIRTKYDLLQVDPLSGVEYFEPTTDDDRCDAAGALRNARRFLVDLAPTQAPRLLCAKPAAYFVVEKGGTTLDVVGALLKKEKHTRHDAPPPPFSEDTGPTLAAPVAYSTATWSSPSKRWTLKVGTVTVLHECAGLLRTSGGRVVVATDTSRVDLGPLPDDDDDEEAPPFSGKKGKTTKTTTTTTQKSQNNKPQKKKKKKPAVAPTAEMRRRRRRRRRRLEAMEVGSAVVLGPVPSRRQLFPSEVASSRGDEVTSASYFWRFLAPLALVCLDAVPKGTRLVVVTSVDDEYAPLAAASDDDDDWRAIGVEPLFVVADDAPLQQEEELLYADQLYSCHFVVDDESETKKVASRRDLLKVAAANLDRVRAALRVDDNDDGAGVRVVVLCGSPGGFRDCEAVVAAATQVAGPEVDVRSFGRREAAAWNGLSTRRFLAADVVIFPRIAERFDVAPLLCLPCRPGTTLLQLAKSRRAQTYGGYSFTKLASDALGFSLATAAYADAAPYADVLAEHLPPMIASAKDRIAARHTFVDAANHDDAQLLDIASITATR
eukprot:CAMPEP_0118905012 /NCGR_PEP_ID=MMETSP1166-20130328/9233_1 /TAXON_ID=1104430 /ORGANISM="Chrysoreinhardia sp, Strain CCMP3193" /LENGTH=910 /DNA_ID=CAMNT_0006844281 /DNA_START=417 /DNA_END=3149 /DNA_ORIENTATION=-